MGQAGSSSALVSFSLQTDPHAGSRSSPARGFPKQSPILESLEGGNAGQGVRVAGCATVASQPVENEGFVSRTSHQRLKSPLGRQPAARMLPAWREQGLLRPCHWQRVCQCPPAPGEPWLCLLLAHQSDESVSTCQCEGMGMLQHSGLLSQPAKSHEQSANSPSFLKKCARMGNSLLSETFFL